MKKSSFDKKLFYWISNRPCQGIIPIYVDDVLWGNTLQLRRIFTISSEKIYCLIFLGMDVLKRNGEEILLHQQSYVDSIDPIELSNLPSGQLLGN